MKWVLRIIIFVPLGVLFLFFAVANRDSVKIFLDPFPDGAAADFSFEAPLYLVVLASMAIGVLAGGVSSWIAHGRYRRAAKAARADAKQARSEADKLRGQALASLSPEPSDIARR
jgi:uncharacterized integral membrane protein